MTRGARKGNRDDPGGGEAAGGAPALVPAPHPTGRAGMPGGQPALGDRHAEHGAQGLGGEADVGAPHPHICTLIDRMDQPWFPCRKCCCCF